MYYRCIIDVYEIEWNRMSVVGTSITFLSWLFAKGEIRDVSVNPCNIHMIF